MPTRVKDQLGMDEVVVQDEAAEAALEERLKRKNSAKAVRALFDEADQEAKGLLLALIPEDAEVVRIGRFRITRTVSKSRSVAFETPGGKVRLRIDDGDEE